MLVEMKLDLATPEGRAAMRAWLDAVERPKTTLDDAAYFAAWTRGWQAAEAAAEVEPAEASPKQSTLERLATPVAAWTPSAPFGAEPAPISVIPGEMRNEQSAGARPEEPPPAPAPEPDIEDEDPGPAPIEDAGPLEYAPDPEPAPPAETAPVDVLDVAGLDPDRPWTDEIKAQVWALAATGLSMRAIAERVSMRYTRVQGYVKNVHSGRAKRPANEGASTALATLRATAVAVREEKRPVARDPEIVAGWQEDLARRERENVVARSYFQS